MHDPLNVKIHQLFMLFPLQVMLMLMFILLEFSAATSLPYTELLIGCEMLL